MRANKVLKCFILLSLLSFLLASHPASAGETPGGDRSVGLVLSGGGAKGVAHIGVLQALEENDIPIDYITGTSMGAIVGALYACGYSPAEMMQFLGSQYFSSMSTGALDPSLTFYFSRQKPSPQMFSVALGGKNERKKNFNPQSLIAPSPMSFGFMQIFSPYSAQCGGDFDRLFVPFRCIGSNVSERHPQVFDSGNLGDAVRSSMSFPIVFQPVLIDSCILYDGGLYDNFPVATMDTVFHPDVMLGVDVSATSSDTPPNSYLDQISFLVTQPQSYKVPADKGMKMRLHLDEFGLLDFDKAKEIYLKGYQYAMGMMDSIKARVACRRPASEVAAARAAFKARTPEIFFDKVIVSGGTPRQNDYIGHLFEPPSGKGALSLSQAVQPFYRALSSDKIESLYAKADTSTTTPGMFTLRLDANVRQRYDVGVGGYLTTSNNSFLYVRGGISSLSFSSLNLDLEAWVGQSYMAAALSGRIDLHSYVPSAFRFLGVASRTKYHETEKLFYRDADPAFVTSYDYFGRVSYALAVGRSGEFEIGFGGGRNYDTYHQSRDKYSFTSEPDRLALDMGQIFVSYKASTVDQQNYPTMGYDYSAFAYAVTGNASYKYAVQPAEKMSDKLTWAQVRLNARHYTELSKFFSLGFEGTAVVSTRKLLRDYYSSVTVASAYAPTPASHNTFATGLRANSFAAVGVVPVYKYNSRLQARLNASVFVPYRRFVLTDNGGVRYGKRLDGTSFFGEADIVFSLPFANICAYGNYSSAQHDWNLGLSIGLYLTAPSFL